MTNENSLGFVGLRTLITAPGAIDAALASIAARSPPASPEPMPPKPAAPASWASPPDRPDRSGKGLGWWIAAGIAALIVWGALNQPPPRTAGSSSPRSKDIATSSVNVTAERVPAVADNAVLGDAEIRYCVFQGKRLEAAAAAVDKYSETQIDRYNALVNDYNGRCSSFRYRADALERIRREAETNRAQLGREGVTLLAGYH
jgi:hypothetical protein